MRFLRLLFLTNKQRAAMSIEELGAASKCLFTATIRIFFITVGISVLSILLSIARFLL